VRDDQTAAGSYELFVDRAVDRLLGPRFEEDDGENVLVTPEDVIFRPDANPHLMHAGPGQVNPAVALATLKRDGCIEVERGDGLFRIRLKRLHMRQLAVIRFTLQIVNLAIADWFTDPARSVRMPGCVCIDMHDAFVAASLFVGIPWLVGFVVAGLVAVFLRRRRDLGTD
jgi:hypothetical protein